MSFSSQHSHDRQPAANTRYLPKKNKSGSYAKRPPLEEDHKVPGAEQSYLEQYSLMPLQRHNDSHFNPMMASSSLLKPRAYSPSSIAKSLSSFVQNSPLRQTYQERVGDSRVLPLGYRQTPGSPKRKGVPANRKAQRSFHQDMNSSGAGSPRRMAAKRPGSSRKAPNIVQNMPHFTKKTIRDLNAHDEDF